MSSRQSPRDPLLESVLERRAARFLTPLEDFICKQTTASMLLLFAAILSVCIASSPWQTWLESLAQMELGIVFQNMEVVLTLQEWISSGLMALFFLLISLEVKREMLAGSLQEFRHVTSIFFAASGGMVLPALIYYALNYNTPAAHGWAIPMATDTAFAIAALAVLLKRSSPGLAIFLAALAIFDDLGAIIVVALFYSQQLQYMYILGALIPFGFLLTLNILGVRRGWMFAVFGIVLWWCIHQSGVHATFAGVLIAMTVPSRTQRTQNSFIKKIRSALLLFEQKLDFRQRILESPEQHELGMDLERFIKSAMTPLQRWHSFLLNPVALFVLPIFALFSAGIHVSGESIAAAASSPVCLGIILGLVVGKPVGITLCVVLGRKFGIGDTSHPISKIIMLGMLSGIGFTMSLFIATLSFPGSPELIQSAKMGIVVASVISACAAAVWSVVVKEA